MDASTHESRDLLGIVENKLDAALAHVAAAESRINESLARQEKSAAERDAALRAEMSSLRHEVEQGQANLRQEAQQRDAELRHEAKQRDAELRHEAEQRDAKLRQEAQQRDAELRHEAKQRDAELRLEAEQRESKQFKAYISALATAVIIIVGAVGLMLGIGRSPSMPVTANIPPAVQAAPPSVAADSR